MSRVDAERVFAADFAALQPAAVRYAAKRIGSIWADDVVQEAFLSLWRAYYSQGTPPRERPDRVLYRTLRNCIIARRLVERNREALDDQHTIDITHRLQPRLDADRVADGNMLQARIDHHLADLPELTAAVFRSVMRNDWDVRAAAAELDIPYQTARGHFARARRRLAESLAQDGYSIPPLKPRGRDGGKRI